MDSPHLNMTKDLTYTACTVQEILDVIFFIKKKEKTQLWFRGQGPYGNLTPSLLRNAKPIRDQKGRKRTTPTLAGGTSYSFPDQFAMVEEFKRISSHTFKTVPKNVFEWLCIMQHYGLPTKLLDWTVDPMIALFFATDIAKCKIQKMIREGGCGAELWILPPFKLNEHSQFKNTSYIFTSSDDHVKSFLDGVGDFLPIAIDAPYIEERLILQKCCFTMHGHDIRPLNHMCCYREGWLYKIEIPSRSLPKIKKCLNDFGHTHDYYYPNDHAKYTHIQKKELKKFLDWYNKYKEQQD